MIRIEEIDRESLPLYKQRGYDIAVNQAAQCLKDIESGVRKSNYICVDCGGSKSQAIPFVCMLSERQFVVATDLKDRCKDYFDFRDNVMYYGKKVTMDLTNDAILITRENRRDSMYVANRKKPHVLVVTVQYLMTLNDSDLKELVKDKIVCIDEVYESCIVHSLNIGAMTGSQCSSDENIPYLELEQIKDSSILDNVRAANNIVRQEILKYENKINGIIIPDEARALYTSASEGLAKDEDCYGIKWFKERLDVIAAHKIIASTTQDKSKTSLEIPTDLSALTANCFAFINYDATSMFNLTKNLYPNNTLCAPAMPINANISIIDAASGAQHYTDAYAEDKDFYNNMLEWLQSSNNAAIVPKKVYDSIPNKTYDNGSSKDNKKYPTLTYYGLGDKGSNELRHCHNIVLIGAGAIPPSAHAALALFLLEHEDKAANINTYEDVVNTQMYIDVAASRTASKLIQAAYRSNIREHDADSGETNIWVVLNQNENICPGNKTATKWFIDYMTERNANIIDAALPFSLEKHKKEKTFESLYTKKGKTGDIVRYCIDNDVELTKELCKQFDKTNYTKVFAALSSLPRQNV